MKYHMQGYFARNDHEWKQAVLMRDEYTCQEADCGSNTHLDAAHIIPRSQDRSLRLYVPNGITLCRHHSQFYTAHPRHWNRFAIQWLASNSGDYLEFARELLALGLPVEDYQAAA